MKGRCLTLLRHAHAEHQRTGQRDFDRALDARGVAEAHSAAGQLALLVGPADLILCSPARRTRQTAEALCTALARPLSSVAYEPALYLAEPHRILEILRQRQPLPEHVLVVGHNPGLSELAAQLRSPVPGGLGTGQWMQIPLRDGL